MLKLNKALDCGCKMTIRIDPSYNRAGKRNSWNDFGRVDVSPECSRDSHQNDLEEHAATILKTLSHLAPS